MKYIAIDPGPHTGFAVCNGDAYQSWEAPSGAVVSILRNIAQPGDRIIYEKFEITASTARKDVEPAYVTLHLIGAIKLVASDIGCTVYEQRPNDQNFARNSDWHLLRSMGWHSTEGDGHCNSAGAHLLKYMSDRRLLSIEQFTRLVDLEFGL